MVGSQNNLVEALYIQFTLGLRFLLPDVLDLMAKLWTAWKAHPDYENYYKWAKEWGMNVPTTTLYPVCVAVFKHEEGIRGDTSYMIGTPVEMLRPNNLDWAESTLGEFRGLAPLPSDIRLEPQSVIRNSYIANSPMRGGNAYECRIVLKVLLPAKLHKWVNLARKTNSQPKWKLLPVPPPGQDRKDRSWWPAWYKDNTKAELFLRGYEQVAAPALCLPPEVRPAIEHYMTLEDFWNAATGRMKSTDVSLHVTHQMDLL